MKTLLVLFILFVAFSGFSQSKKAINKQLTTDYNRIDAKVDSLLAINSFEMGLEKQLLDSFNIEVKAAHEKEKLFTELIDDIALDLRNLKLLGIEKIDKLEFRSLDTLLLRFSALTVESTISEVRKLQSPAFFGFSKYEVPELMSYSTKDQNTVLLLLIQQRVKEEDILTENIGRVFRLQSAIKSADSSLNFLAHYKEFHTSSFLSILDMLDMELSKQRMHYMKNGPTGFPSNYHRVFPDVFPETGPDIDFVNQTLASGSMFMNEEIFSVAEQEAEFPGGNGELINFTRKNLHFPPEAMDKGLEGKCYVRFIVSSSGKISEVSIIKGVPNCESCNKEAVRFIESMPVWSPAKVGGRNVNSYVILPVNFKLK